MKTLVPGLLLLMPTLAMAAGGSMSLGGLTEAVIWLIVAGLIVGLLLWAVGKAPFIAEPWKNGITYFIYAMCVLLAINFLLSLIGEPLFRLR